MCPEQTALLQLEHMTDLLISLTQKIMAPLLRRGFEMGPFQIRGGVKEKRTTGSSADAPANMMSCKDHGDSIGPSTHLQAP